MAQDTHPGEATLARLMNGSNGASENRAIVEHLFAGCTACRSLTAELAGFSGRARDHEPSSPYLEAFARARRAARERIEALRREAQNINDFVELLLKHPPQRQRLLLDNSERGKSWALCLTLLGRSFSLRFDNPRRMVELAELALEVAARLDRTRYGTSATVDLQARAAAELANAHRVDGNIEKAMQIMLGALQLLEHGSADPLLRARVYDLASSIFRQQRRFELSVLLLERSFRIYRHFGERHAAGRVLIKLAVTEGQRPDPATSLKLLCQAVELIDAERDRSLAWHVIHNMLWALADLGRYSTAEELLAESRGLCSEYGDRLDDLRLSWLEGKIAAGLGREIEAEVKLREVTLAYDRFDSPYDASLARLDLALLLAGQRRVAELKELVGDMVLRFRTLKLEREAILALVILRRSLDRPELPLTLISRVRSFLRRLPHEKGLLFAQVH